MQIKTKQRLIGILILLAILAIFLPLLFHNSYPSTEVGSMAIPPKPTITSEPSKTEIVLQRPEAAPSEGVTVAEKSAPVAPQQTQSVSATSAASPAVSTPPSPPPVVSTLPSSPAPAPAASVPAPQSEPIVANTTEPLVATSTLQANLQKHKAQVISQQKGLSQFMAEPNAWSVQLGTFSDVAHANALLELLRKKGFDAYVRPIINEKGNHLVRVYVGPEVRQESAIQLRNKLEASVHLKGIVQKYQIKTQ